MKEPFLVPRQCAGFTLHDGNDSPPVDLSHILFNLRTASLKTTKAVVILN